MTPATYDVALGLVPEELVAFLEASQPKEWEQLCLRPVVRRRRGRSSRSGWRDEITARGTVDVLRRGVKDSGCRSGWRSSPRRMT